MTFEEWKEFYEWEFTTKEELQEIVNEGGLTQEQYEKIVNPKEIITPPIVKEPENKVPASSNSATTIINAPSKEVLPDATTKESIESSNQTNTPS